MKKDSFIDYATYILFRILGALIRSLPLECALFVGRIVGDIVYYTDCRHKAIAYANLKTVFAGERSPGELNRLSRRFYRHLGQSLIEIFLIPRIDKAYIEKYITIEGYEYIEQAFRRGKGVIFAGIHEGSWELYNIITANLGFPFHFLVRDQGVRYRRVVALLNEYRRQKGCRLIYRTAGSLRKDDMRGVRDLVRVLRDNEAVGMSVDQGGRSGIPVPFFGREASMATGALRLALRYDAAIIPSFIIRRRGPHNTIYLEPPFIPERTGNPDEDLEHNLSRLVAVYEKYLRRHPEEYLWTYRVWKYSSRRTLLIIHDGKAGHLRQSQAVAREAEKLYRKRGIRTQIRIAQVGFSSSLLRRLLPLGTVLAGKYRCQGCNWCLRRALTSSSYRELRGIPADMVISCGSSLAPVNYVISRENNCRSVVVMRPAFVDPRKFDLVIIPRHDRPHQARNVVVTDGALSLVDDEYLAESRQQMLKAEPRKLDGATRYVGLLLGGDAKGFCLQAQQVRTVLRQVKAFCGERDFSLLLTTSRRTSATVARAVKEELEGYARCALLIVANERNFPSAVGGILGLSETVICSPESISMVSEAINSRRRVIVFPAPGLSAKHRRFLEHCAQSACISLVEAEELKRALDETGPAISPGKGLRDTERVSAALEKLL